MFGFISVFLLSVSPECFDFLLRYVSAKTTVIYQKELMWLFQIPHEPSLLCVEMSKGRRFSFLESAESRQGWMFVANWRTSSFFSLLPSRQNTLTTTAPATAATGRQLVVGSSGGAHHHHHQHSQSQSQSQTPNFNPTNAATTSSAKTATARSGNGRHQDNGEKERERPSITKTLGVYSICQHEN